MDKIHAKRCQHCDSVSPYIMHPRAREEFEAKKRSDRKKKLKIFGITLGFLAGLVLLGNIVGLVGSQITLNRELNDSKKAAESIEQIHGQWQSASDTCGLNYSVKKEFEGDPVHESGYVEVYIRIEDAGKLSSFWISETGKALDCFSELTLGASVSRYFNYSNDQILNLKNGQSIHLYDEVFTDQTVTGVLGADDHLAGDLTFLKKGEYSDLDFFTISLSWELKKAE